MIPLDQTLSFYISMIMRLPLRRRKMLYHIKWCIDHGKEAKVSGIAKFARSSERNVQKFFKYNEDMGCIFFRVEKIIEKGWQQPNKYHFNRCLDKAITWMDIYGYKYAEKTKHDKIVSHMENEEKFTPPPIKKFTPLKDLKTLKDEERKRRAQFVIINPILEDLKMPLEAKVYASRTFSEYEIARAVESMQWRMRNGKIKTTQAAYIIGTCKKLRYKNERKEKT